MRPLRESAFDASRSFKKTIQESYKGKTAQVEGRYKLFNKGKDKL